VTGASEQEPYPRARDRGSASTAAMRRGVAASERDEQTDGRRRKAAEAAHRVEE
jgi:hypothetical protein